MSIVTNLPSEIHCWDNVESITESASLSKELADITQKYQTINIADTMSTLKEVGSLWKAALVGNMHLPCSPRILRTLSRCQSLSYDMTGCGFVRQSLQALGYHKLVLTMVQKQKVDIAMKLLVKTEEIAKKMTKTSQDLAKASQDLAETFQDLEKVISELPKEDDSSAKLVKTLGILKSTFENTREFWKGIEKQCEELSKVKIINVDDSESKNIDAIDASGLNWLALGKINNTAYISLSLARKNIDQVMCNLPVGQ